ncbi:hypothetical protein [Streptomyces sp. BE230]|nr:hypothetical protein [Streptomyces sp. BE230]
MTDPPGRADGDLAFRAGPDRMTEDRPSGVGGDQGDQGDGLVVVDQAPPW